MLGNLIFLSYRRADAAPHALALKMVIEEQLRAVSVFLDTHHIQDADRWEREIEVALKSAKVVIAVIGRDWAGIEDGEQRRLDDPADWVRREISTALREKPNAVLPVLIDGAAVPGAETLPPDCRDLPAIQGIVVDLNSWESSVGNIVGSLADRFGFARKQANWKYPQPDPLVASTIPVPWPDLDAQVRNFLPEWSIEFVDDKKQRHHKHIELSRTFEFDTFRKAMEFMQVVAEHAEAVQHHPRWENLWRNVKVSLSTWDAGHRVTALDLEFARYLDRTFNQFKVNSTLRRSDNKEDI
jgi:pterin-4a-carbinolamine dehydratase